MSERRPNDSCRICKSSFKVKFGNIRGKQVYSSSENLFKPSQRKDSPGVVLAEVCSCVRLVFLHDPVIYSDCVCNPCGQKIHSLGQLFEFVKARYIQKCMQQQKWQKREHSGEFGKYGKNDNFARIANMAKHKAMRGPIKVGDTGKFGKW